MLSARGSRRRPQNTKVTPAVSPLPTAWLLSPSVYSRSVLGLTFRSYDQSPDRCGHPAEAPPSAARIQGLQSASQTLARLPHPFLCPCLPLSALCTSQGGVQALSSFHRTVSFHRPAVSVTPRAPGRQSPVHFSPSLETGVSRPPGMLARRRPSPHSVSVFWNLSSPSFP